MRVHQNLALLLAWFVVPCARAEDRVSAVNPDPVPLDLSGPAKLRAASPDARPLEDPIPQTAVPPSLLPDDIPPAPARRTAPPRPETPGKIGGSLKPQVTAAEFDLRIRYRQARNVAEASEAVRAAWDGSREAKTDLRKRQALRHYYDVLFAKMVAMDRAIAPLVEQRHKAENARLTQSQIAPTVDAE